MATTDYKLFFVIGMGINRPHNRLEFWPTTAEKGSSINDNMPIQTMTARQIYEYEA